MTERNKKYILTLIEKDLKMTITELSYVEKIASGEEDIPITHMYYPRSWFEERKDFLVEQKQIKIQTLDRVKELDTIEDNE